MAPNTCYSSKAKATTAPPHSESSVIRNRRRQVKSASSKTTTPADSGSLPPRAAPHNVTVPPVIEKPSPDSSSPSPSVDSIDYFDPAQVSCQIENTNVVLGDSDERTRNLHSNCKKYANQKNNAYKKFFEAIASHPTLSHLAEVVDDPDCADGSKEHRLIILCCGVKKNQNIIFSILPF